MEKTKNFDNGLDIILIKKNSIGCVWFSMSLGVDQHVYDPMVGTKV